MRIRLDTFRKKNMHRGLYLGLLVALVALRLLIAACGRAFLLPQGSGLDDMLMVRAAQSLVEGNWLGEYGSVAIAKHMGFAFWLALLHLLGIPVLLANAALWIAACGFAVWALKPLLPGNISRVIAFAFFSFQPVSFAFFNLRIYRDAIYPALCMLFFAGILGMALRLRQKRTVQSLLCGVVAGIGLAAAWLSREEGIVLLLFAVCAAAVILLAVWIAPAVNRKTLKTCICIIPFVVLLAASLLVSALNQKNYGVFAVSDMTQGEFPAAYGAVTAVSLGESGFVQGVPVTLYALDRLYEEVPSMALLQPYLEQGPAYNGYFNRDKGEFGGSFYFALRVAAAQAGQMPDGAEAQVFWRQLRLEIEQAVEEGRLQSAKPVASTVPLWDNTLLAPTAAEVGASAAMVLFYKDCDPRPTFSLGEQALIDETAQWLNVPVQQGYAEGTDQPYYNIVQRVVFAGCDILIGLYRIITLPLLCIGLIVLAWGTLKCIKALKDKNTLPGLALWILLLGLLFSFLVRLVVAAYMEVSAFGIGTYIMYLSAAMPPLLLFCVAAPALWLGQAPAKLEQQEGIAADEQSV